MVVALVGDGCWVLVVLVVLVGTGAGAVAVGCVVCGWVVGVVGVVGVLSGFCEQNSVVPLYTTVPMRTCEVLLLLLDYRTNYGSHLPVGAS
jgi:hypothetical protein